ncbi:MAG: hypothetical protein VX470_10565, partial [Planctomycetota bacterium]|nr:hypothetical protein [Planctomycetota bacterium]
MRANPSLLGKVIGSWAPKTRQSTTDALLEAPVESWERQMVKGLLTKLVLLTTESLGTLTLGAVERSIVKPRTVTLIALTLIALTLGGGGGFSSVWGQAETANAASQETVKATEKATETWNNARLWGQPEAPPPFQPKRVYQGVLLKQPVGMARTP